MKGQSGQVQCRDLWCFQRRARDRDRGRPHERRHHSSAGEKQRYYSCEPYGNREHCHTKSAGPQPIYIPGESQDAGLLKQPGSTVVKSGSLSLTSGTSTPGRGRRQLPQTPLTPRPAVAYKTRFSRGLSEHERLLTAYDKSPIPVTHMTSDPSLNPLQQDISQQCLLDDTEDFQDTVSTHGGAHTARNIASTTDSAPHGTAAMPATAGGTQGRTGAVPNGYHFTLGVNSASGSGSRGTGSLREREEKDWC
ncbi:voltage-dependent N-type calcium channel subunit alpha-1B-like [Thalassophryne amazonica]|uniref:voltage-dependent N-type calcium channel subunit alpha-1B-like n=1 Tax=Thalassophryne amazonica TaxID=390379 RepID=UPI001470B5BD|nr:voltage-dependent N-type calcium channel subunit alpha-1B-like [Thalassophryne amazonica]